MYTAALVRRARVDTSFHPQATGNEDVVCASDCCASSPASNSHRAPAPSTAWMTQRTLCLSGKPDARGQRLQDSTRKNNSEQATSRRLGGAGGESVSDGTRCRPGR